MTYQVLARKWRPQNFTDMVGQDHISSTLCNAIQNQRVGHAYLFVGTRGTGKTTTARIFAKAINCESPLPDNNPCNQCTNCTEITQGSSMDVLEIDGASNNGVDDIRRLRDNVQYTPARCKFKVYIIDEVHMLSTAAWNALLKTLEEPPEHVKFLFATTEVHKVLPTILSRCQRFDLKRISQGTIARRLKHIAEQENASFEQAALNSIARAANGGMRDALSIMDQMIAFCSNQQSISEHDVSEVFGLTSSYDLAKITTAMLNNDAAALIHEINRLADLGRDLEQLYSDLLHFCRNLMICSISGQQAGEILDLDDHDLKTATKIASQVAPDTLQKLVDGFLSNDGKLRHTLNKRVFIEMTLIRIMKDAHAVSLNDILQRINALRQGGTLEALEQSAPQVSAPISLPEEPQKKNDSQNVVPAAELPEQPEKALEPALEEPPANEEPLVQETITAEKPKQEEAAIEETTAEPAIAEVPASPILENPPELESAPLMEQIPQSVIAADEPIPQQAPEPISEPVIENLATEVPPETVSEPVTPEPEVQQSPLEPEKPSQPEPVSSITANSTSQETEKTEIDDSYEVDFSTFMGSDFSESARKTDPLNLGFKKYQGAFNPDEETPGSALGLYRETASQSAPETAQAEPPEEPVKTTPQPPIEENLVQEKAAPATEETVQVKPAESPRAQESFPPIPELPVDTLETPGTVEEPSEFLQHVSQKIEEIRDSQSEYQPAQDVPAAPETTSAPLPPQEQGPSNEEQAQNLWQALHAEASPDLANFMQQISPLALQQNTFIAACENPDGLNNPNGLAHIENILKQMTGNSQLEFKLVSAAKTSESDGKKLSSSEEVWERVRQDAFISGVCQEFNGTIIDVRG